MQAAAVVDGEITSDGPLTFIRTTPDLGCAVNHVLDPDHGEFYDETACATLVAVGGTLYGPETIPAGSSAEPRTTWTPSSQESSGAGTSIDPYRIITIVTGGDLTVTQTDTYVVGSEAYGTRVAIANNGDSAHTVTLYRPGTAISRTTTSASPPPTPTRARSPASPAPSRAAASSSGRH